MGVIKTSVDTANTSLELAISQEMLESALSPMSTDILSIKADMVTFGSKVDEAHAALDSTVSQEMLEAKLFPMSTDILAIKVDIATCGNKVDAAHSTLETAVSLEMLEAKLSLVSADILSIKADMGTFGSKATDIKEILGNIQEVVEEKVSMQTLQHSVGDIRTELGDLSAIVARTNSSMADKVSESAVGTVVAGVHREIDVVKRELAEKASQQQLEATIAEMQIGVEERMENTDVIIELKSVRQECEEMRGQWMRLGGHMNPQQRIQHVADIKMENNQLRDELMYTRKQLEASGRQLRRQAVFGNVEESVRHSPHASPRRGRHVRGGC